MEVLDELLRIKRFREDKSERELIRARHALAQSTRLVEQTHRERDRYYAKADRQERELYRDLCSRVVRLTDLDGVAYEVDQMRGEKIRHEERLDEVREQKEKAAELADEARQRHVEAVLEREKFSELSREAALEQERFEQRREDAEMEEVRTLPSMAVRMGEEAYGEDSFGAEQERQ